MATMVLTEAIAPGNDTPIQKLNTLTGSARLSVEESVADGQTNKQIVCAVDVSAVKAFYLVSSQDVTFETNSGSSPADTIALKAGVPYVWHPTSYHAFLLGTDVTSIFITNASGSAATVQMEVLTDATP